LKYRFLFLRSDTINFKDRVLKMEGKGLRALTLHSLRANYYKHNYEKNKK